MADRGCAVAGYDNDQAEVEALRQESRERDVRGAAGFVSSSQVQKCCTPWPV